ncbi:MAG: hypothetical protein JXB25_01540 [Deltaproteobacteria bacterium]|nr:hypothetical protein [Deltaproteobacteria bacterium]
MTDEFPVVCGKSLTFYHLEEHSSGRHLLQVLAQVNVEDLVAPGQTAVLDRYYQCRKKIR